MRNTVGYTGSLKSSYGADTIFHLTSYHFSRAQLDREFPSTQEAGCVWISKTCAQLYTSIGYSHAGLVSKLVRQIAKAWNAESGYR